MNEHTHISESSPVHVHHKARSAVPTLATIVLRNPFLYGMVPSGGAAGRAHAVGMRVMYGHFTLQRAWLEIDNCVCTSMKACLDSFTLARVYNNLRCFGSFQLH